MDSDVFTRNGLTLDRLRSFLAVADAGSISKAAPHNPARQGQFSRQIGDLEDVFGLELTRRDGRSAVLTEAGLRLASLVRHHFQDIRDFASENHQQPRSFSIGAGTSVLEWLVVPAAPAIAKALGSSTNLRLDSYRSVALVEAVGDGRVDFAVVRGNAVPKGQKKKPLRHLSFHLCVPRKLLPKGTTDGDLIDPKLWQKLPFAAGKDGGQLDAVIREAMTVNGVVFHPRFECVSILLVRQLIQQGDCAGILPSVGLAGLSRAEIAMVEFPPLKGAGRALVLHWNERQMRRRAVSDSTIADIANALGGANAAKVR